MAELGGLGYHLDQLSQPKEKLALGRRVLAISFSPKPHVFMYLQYYNTHPVILRAGTPRHPVLHHTRQNFPSPLLHPRLLHPQIPDPRLPRGISSPGHWHRCLLPDNLPMLTHLLCLGSERRPRHLY